MSIASKGPRSQNLTLNFQNCAHHPVAGYMAILSFNTVRFFRAASRLKRMSIATEGAMSQNFLSFARHPLADLKILFRL